MALADELRADVAAFLSDAGLGRSSGGSKPITVQRATPGTYDPDTGTAGAAKIKTYTGNGRMGSYSDYLRNSNTLIKDGDRRVTFVPDDTTFEPTTNDTLTVKDDATYSIISVGKREVNGTAIAFTLQVRK